MTLRNNPIETGLDRFFKMGKAAEYLGQKALEQIAESGPDKRMVRLVVPGAAIANPRGTYAMEVGEAKRSGEVTSITYSPRFNYNVGLGYVPADASDVGTQVVIHGPDEIVTGQIANNDWRTSD